MQKHKILEMLNNGQIEEAKSILRDEIYADSLKTKPDVKQRYNAMKRYVSYNKGFVPAAYMNPRVISFEEKQYTAFMSEFSAVLTTEPIGEIELFESQETTLGIEKIIKWEGNTKEIDFNSIFAEAKSKGYRLKKSIAVKHSGATYFFCYDGAYYNIGVLNAAFSVINNGKNTIVYHKVNDARAPLIIKNDIGICAVLPVFLDRWDIEPIERLTIIEVK